MSRRAGAQANRAGDATEANGVFRRQRCVYICDFLTEAAT